MYYLVIYWFIFWQKFLRNPYLLSTSEIATTNFPHWIWMGRKWRATDEIYYKYPASIPFMSMWYFPNVLVSKLSRYLSLDSAFKLYVYFILAHYLLASIIAYKVLGLFGALTLTYAGYCIKPQTPSFVYTMTWMPGMIIPGPMGIFSCFMAITGGYWPILVYFMPVAVFLNPWCLLGLIPALPQIISFLYYWPKSVRHKADTDRTLGRIPFWKLKDLILPTNNTSPTNGVHYPEMAMYMGIAPLFIWHLSWWWIPVLISGLIGIGALPQFQRIPSRIVYLLTFSIVCIFVPNTTNHFLCLLQAVLLLMNNSIYPSFPFSQWWDKPSKIYPKFDYTGYLENKKINTYLGGFSLKGAS